MPDVAPDIHQPLRDSGHESLRQSIVAALDAIAVQVERMDHGFLLLLGTGQGMQGTLDHLQSMQAALAQHQQAITDLNTRVTAVEARAADLETRVTALENPPSTTPA